jgi:hypothetical protein
MKQATVQAPAFTAEQIDGMIADTIDQIAALTGIHPECYGDMVRAHVESTQSLITAGPDETEAAKAQYTATAEAFIPVFMGQRNADLAVGKIKALTGRLLGMNG